MCVSEICVGVGSVDLVVVVGDVHGLYLEDINQSYHYLIFMLRQGSSNFSSTLKTYVLLTNQGRKSNLYSFPIESIFFFSTGDKVLYLSSIQRMFLGERRHTQLLVHKIPWRAAIVVFAE